MTRNLALCAALLLSLAACSAKSDSSTATASAGQAAGDFTAAVQFSPDPPKQGAETLTVTVKDASGSPVKGATVKIATNMPVMAMAGPTLTATDNGDGTYSAQTTLNYATKWAFDVAISAGGKNGTLKVTQDIK